MMSSNRINVTGTVQGVGFRYFVKRLADTFGVKGFVRNMDDGSVEIEAECDLKTITSFTADLRTKHPWAKVKDINIEKIDHRRDFRTFEIRT